MLLASIISFLFSHEHNFFSNMPTQSFVWILSNLWVSDLSAVTIQFLWYFLKPRAHPYGTLKATDTSIFYRLTLQSIRFAALKVIYISFQHYSQLQIFKRIAYLHLVLSICYNLTRDMSMKLSNLHLLHFADPYSGTLSSKSYESLSWSSRQAYS